MEWSELHPLAYRYIKQDAPLKQRIESDDGLDIYSRITSIVSRILVPRLASLEIHLRDIATQNVILLRRVDGKHDGLTSVGEIFDGYANRLHYRTREIVARPLTYETDTQANDGLSDLVYHSVCALSVQANIANDIRHQFRDGIDEVVFKKFGSRVGSSTMPHKMNPAEFEFIVSFWKAYIPRVTSMLFGQVIEHQGDATDNYVPGMAFEVVCALSYVTKSLDDSLTNLRFVGKRDESLDISLKSLS